MRPICVYWAVSILHIKGFIGQGTDEVLVQLLHVMRGNWHYAGRRERVAPSGVRAQSVLLEAIPNLTGTLIFYKYFFMPTP